MSAQWKFQKTETVKISITKGNKTVNPLVLAPSYAKKYSYDQYYNAHTVIKIYIWKIYWAVFSAFKFCILKIYISLKIVL